ncbi:HAD family hydrolase [Vibrio neptunius]|uniref:HAD family hydrolase n=1 Tax=Vibrio neptunius TaxID=170651 RepID=UPI001C5CA9B9|nr:HAD family phosphatase [Vibrio neptunius]QXX07973.1 HAD family phosphatase [Vibrio neptunius]
MLKAVLFDMDGLIFDSESIYKQSWQFADLEQGLSLSDDFYQQFIGVQDPECEQQLVDYFQSAIDIHRYRSIRDQHYHNLRSHGIPLKPGFEPLLSAIKQRDLLTAIVTSSQRSDVEHNFRTSHYLAQFDLIISAEDVTLGKPNPDCYKMAYCQLGVDAKQCLVLEDSNNGIKAALAAECNAVMIPDLLPPLRELKSKITVLNQLDEVIPLLDNM